MIVCSCHAAMALLYFIGVSNAIILSNCCIDYNFSINKNIYLCVDYYEYRSLQKAIHLF